MKKQQRPRSRCRSRTPAICASFPGTSKRGRILYLKPAPITTNYDPKFLQWNRRTKPAGGALRSATPRRRSRACYNHRRDEQRTKPSHISLHDKGATRAAVIRSSRAFTILHAVSYAQESNFTCCTVSQAIYFYKTSARKSAKELSSNKCNQVQVPRAQIPIAFSACFTSSAILRAFPQLVGPYFPRRAALYFPGTHRPPFFSSAMQLPITTQRDHQKPHPGPRFSNRFRSRRRKPNADRFSPPLPLAVRHSLQHWQPQAPHHRRTKRGPQTPQPREINWKKFGSKYSSSFSPL